MKAQVQLTSTLKVRANGRNTFIHSQVVRCWWEGRSLSIQREWLITPGPSLSVDDKDPCLHKLYLAALIWSAESSYKGPRTRRPISCPPGGSVRLVMARFVARLAWDGRENTSRVSCCRTETCWQTARAIQEVDTRDGRCFKGTTLPKIKDMQVRYFFFLWQLV